MKISCRPCHQLTSTLYPFSIPDWYSLKNYNYAVTPPLLVNRGDSWKRGIPFYIYLTSRWSAISLGRNSTGKKGFFGVFFCFCFCFVGFFCFRFEGMKTTAQQIWTSLIIQFTLYFN